MKKRRGHYCWCCDRVRANEKFSGRGHARHLCSDCAKLGGDELAYRQAVRKIDRLVDWSRGVAPRKQKRCFEQFLLHPNERVRRYAEKVAADDAQACEAYRQERLAWQAEERAFEMKQDPCDDEVLGALDEPEDDRGRGGA